MKILYFLADPGGIGGASNVMIKQAFLMLSEGHETRVIIQNDKNGIHSKDIDRVCLDFGLDTRDEVYTTAICIEEININESITDSKRIREQIELYKPDIVHSLQINTSVELACRELGLPHVMSIYPISDGMFNIRWENVFPFYLISDSEYYCKKWREGLGVKAECIRVSYDISESNIAESRYSEVCEILCVGILSSYKNQLEVIKFVEKANKEKMNVHLTILGYCDNNYGYICRKYVDENKLNGLVCFEGFVHNVDDYLRKADLLIHASLKESYPGVIVEAMANKVAVLVTGVGGIPELVKDGANGFVINGVDAEGIYDCFVRYNRCKEKGHLNSIVENGFQTYIENHSGQAVYDKLKKCYMSIIRDYRESGCSRCFGQFVESNFNISVKKKAISEYTLKHTWYIWHIKKEIILRRYKTAYIWGAGTFGCYALEWCQALSLDIKGFLDTSKKGEYLGYSVYEPSNERLKSVDVVFVAIADFDVCRKLVQRMEEIGKARNQDFFLLVNNSCM